MTIETKTPSTHVGDGARLMADDRSCPYSVWFRSRRSSVLWANGSDPNPIDRDPRRTSLIRKTAAGLEGQGHRVYPALRNHFEASGSRSGARLKGRPDLIGRDPDGGVTVNDVREGSPSEADELQVRLHLHLLPRSNHGRWRGSRPAGRVLYVDGSERRIYAHEIDEEFVERVAAVMRQIAPDEPAGFSPSAEECGRCPLTAEHCSDRIEAPAGRVTKERPVGLHDACWDVRRFQQKGAPAHVRAPPARDFCLEHPGSYPGWRSPCPNGRRSPPDPAHRKPVERLLLAHPAPPKYPKFLKSDEMQRRCPQRPHTGASLGRLSSGYHLSRPRSCTRHKPSAVLY